MEFYGHGTLEELLTTQRGNLWETPPHYNIQSETNNELFSSGWSFDFFDHNPTSYIPNSTFSLEQDHHLINTFNDLYSQFGHELLSGTQQQLSDSSDNYTPISPALQANTDTSSDDAPHFQTHQDEHYMMSLEDEESAVRDIERLEMEAAAAACKMESIESFPNTQFPIFNIGLRGQSDHRRGRVKKPDGQPSKNLMAERRRRKRLNDRLSMLRSIVPKISKMDRTSILGDTIDYMKELLEKISNLQQENELLGSNQLNIVDILRDMKPNEMLIRNSPKFDVERRNGETRIGMCCTTKPDLLVSTISTLESLGLEIQQCVISCFNDFSLQASCSEGVEERASSLLNPGDIKQALFRNAGYGGRCL